MWRSNRGDRLFGMLAALAPPGWACAYGAYRAEPSHAGARQGHDPRRMPLTAPQIERLLTMLQAPVTDFDCGTLCAPTNGGVPVCCHSTSVLPVLYAAELALLQRRSDLWRRHVPHGADAPLQAAARACDVFAVCKGHLLCERDNRSLSCRTFPFEPYCDHSGEFAGIVFCYDLAHLCPLILGQHAIRDDFVAQCCAMWRQLFAFDDEERRFYAAASARLRRSFGRRHEPIPVFTERGVEAMPTQRPRRRGRA